MALIRHGRMTLALKVWLHTFLLVTLCFNFLLYVCWSSFDTNEAWFRIVYWYGTNPKTDKIPLTWKFPRARHESRHTRKEASTWNSIVEEHNIPGAFAESHRSHSPKLGWAKNSGWRDQQDMGVIVMILDITTIRPYFCVCTYWFVIHLKMGDLTHFRYLGMFHFCFFSTKICFDHAPRKIVRLIRWQRSQIIQIWRPETGDQKR